MRELASLGRTGAILRKIGTFSDMLFVAIKSFFAIPKYGEIAADSMAGTHTDVRKWTFVASAATVVGEMYTQWCTLGCRFMGQLTSVGVVRAIALQEIPTDGDLRRIVLIHACKTTTASTCK